MGLRPDSEGYWKIERTSVTEVLGGPDVEATEDVPGAFPLSKLEAAQSKAQVVPGDVPLIRTAEEPTGYAARVHHGLSPEALTGAGLVIVRVKVDEGSVNVGVLNTSASQFLISSPVGRGAETQEIRLKVKDLSQLGDLVISNNRLGDPGTSVARVYGIELKRAPR